MEEVEVNVLEIDGKEYVLIDSLETNNKKYFYFSNDEDSNDIQIFKEEIESGEKFFVSLDNDTEFNEALIVFSEKYKNII